MKQISPIKIKIMKKITLISSILLIVSTTTRAQIAAPGNYKFVSAINMAPTSGRLNTMYFTNLEDSIVVKDTRYFREKSKEQRTAAWVLLGSGVACTGIGILIFPKDYNGIYGRDNASQENNATFSTIVTIAGLAAMITSIPFFISSSINKHRARVGISYQKTGFGVPVKSDKEIAGITLSFPIGK